MTELFVFCEPMVVGDEKILRKGSGSERAINVCDPVTNASLKSQINPSRHDT